SATAIAPNNHASKATTQRHKQTRYAVTDSILVLPMMRRYSILTHARRDQSPLSITTSCPPCHGRAMMRHLGAGPDHHRRDTVTVRLCYGAGLQQGGTLMDQKIINLWDNFTHSRISRRDFMDELAKLTGSAAAAVALLPLLQNDYAKAQIVSPSDPRLNAEKVSFDSRS